MKKHLIYGITLSLIMGVMSIEAQERVPMRREQTIYIPIIAKGLQAKYWDPVKQGAEMAASDYNARVTFEGPEGEGDTQLQLSMLEAALDENPQAIVLSAVDSRAATPYLERAQAAGIPVIGFDSGVDSPIVSTTVGTDNYEAGVLAADKMVQLLDGKGKVGIIVQDTTSKVATDRRDGFVNTIQQRYPSMEIAAIGYGGGNVLKSKEVAEEMLRNHPDIKGLFGGNEGSAYGVIEAVRALDKEGDVTIIGFDSGKKLIEAIREGVVAGAITQNPIQVGYKAVETAVRAYKGEELPAFINTGIEWYDQTNIDDPRIQELLYE